MFFQLQQMELSPLHAVLLEAIIIPVDPYYMMQRAADVGVPAELITAARAVNRTMPLHVATVLNEILYKAGVPSGSAKVLMLGWSYKAEVGDPRETPAEPLTEALLSKDIECMPMTPHRFVQLPRRGHSYRRHCDCFRI